MDDIQTLFAKDPLELTEPDLETIIAKMRASRKMWVESGTAVKKKTAKQVEAEKITGRISLDDL